MLLLASSAFGFSFVSYGALFVPFLAVLILFGIALGILGSALVLRFGPASEWLVWPIPAFIAPFAAVFYPVSTLPWWMQHLSKLTPPSYVFEGMRSVVADQPVSWGLLLFSAILALFYVFGASWIFVRVFQHTVRTGLLARYSAESA